MGRGKHTRQISREKMKEYGKYFKEVREEMEMSQHNMAKNFGVYRTTIGKWERGTIPQADLSIILKTYDYMINKFRREHGYD